MKEVNLNSNNDINNTIQKNGKKSQYDILKSSYNRYVKDIEKTDFANSYTRCEIERNMLQNMYKLAKKDNNTSELDYIDERYNSLSEKFTQFGIILKKLS